MCVICYIPPHRTLPKSLLKNCQDHNKDGWGIMYAKDGKIVIIKSLGNFEEFNEKWKEIPRNVPRAIHFRMKTHGGIVEDNCHPFMASETIAMMHNGVIQTPMINKERSDSYNYAEYQLKPILQFIPDLSKAKTLLSMIEKATMPSKLLFMQADGVVLRTNHAAWVKKHGCWFSNQASLTKVYSYNYNRNNDYTFGCYNSRNEKHTQTYTPPAVSPPKTELTIVPTVTPPKTTEVRDVLLTYQDFLHNTEEEIVKWIKVNPTAAASLILYFYGREIDGTYDVSDALPQVKVG